MTAARAPIPRKLPAWLAYSLLTIVLWGVWGVQSKMIVDRISPLLNQVLFPIGLVPLAALVLLSPRVREGSHKTRGAWYGLLTGLLGGTGNIAFYMALAKGGKASIVVPVTCLFPLVTVLAARFLLKESMGRLQLIGLGVALAAVYLLSA